MERDYEFSSKRHLSDIKQAIDLGNKAAKQTIRKLSPKKIGSEKISIIFDKRISKGMLSVFASAISCLLYTSPSPRDKRQSRMPSSA